PVAVSAFSLYFFFLSCYCHLRDLHLSLHDALPICSSMRNTDRGSVGADHHSVLFAVLLSRRPRFQAKKTQREARQSEKIISHQPDRKSTRLNSSHVSISYAVFCLKKKNNRDENTMN